MASRLLFASFFALVMACSDNGTTGPAGLAPVATVTIETVTTSLTVGSTLQPTVILRDAAGNELADRTISFASSNESVASVSATGLVQALAAGETTITATSEGKSDQTTITVTVAPVSRLDVTPAGATIEAGQTVRLTARPRTAAGTVISDCGIMFSSANETIARVELLGVLPETAPATTGTVTGLAPGGPVTITVTADCGAAGQSQGPAIITVTAPTSRIIGAVLDADFGFGIHSATVTVSGPVTRMTRTSSAFSPGDFEFNRLPPGDYTVAVTASFVIASGVIVADCQSVTAKAEGGQTTNVVVECAFPHLTGSEIEGDWSYSRFTPQQVGSCPPALPSLASGTMTFDSGNGAIAIVGLDPELTIVGNYDPASGRYTGRGSAVLGDGSSIRTDMTATFGFQAFPLEEGFIFSGVMKRQHRDPGGNLVCTETYEPTGFPM